MSVGLYDKALTDKIKNWVVDPNLIVLGPDESDQLFRWKADITNDKPIELPLISIKRDSDISIGITAKRRMSYEGKIFSNNGLTTDHLNAIPMTLSYQIDIYTRYRNEADEYMRNFVYNIVNHPKMTIDIPYNDSNKQQDSFISLEGTVSDTSDIPERLIVGQFTRYTIPIKVIDAYLFSYNFKDIQKVGLAEIEANKQLENKAPDFSNNLDFYNVE